MNILTQQPYNQFISPSFFTKHTAGLNANILKLLNLKRTDFVGHIGCGQGELVIAMVKTGATVAGIENNDHRVEMARENLKQNGLHGHAAIISANLWDINLCHFSKLYISISDINDDRLEKKLLEELFVGTTVVTSIPQFRHWKPEKQCGTLFLYRR